MYVDRMTSTRRTSVCIQIQFTFYISSLIQEKLCKMIDKEGRLQDMGPEQHQEVVRELKKKMKLMKEAVRQARSNNQQLQAKLYKITDNYRKKETDTKRRDDKNESLLLEIRVLRDALIAQKNETEKLQLKLKEVQSGKTSNSKGGLSSYLGLGGLFQR